MRRSEVLKLVAAKAEEVAKENGVELFSVGTSTKGGSLVLSVKLHSDDGIDHNTCYEVHQKLDQYLDELDPFKNEYFLEVASPGLDAKLDTTHTLKLSIGKEVEFRTYVAGESWPKSAIGVLTEVNDDYIIVVKNEETYKVDRKMISSIRLHFTF